MPNKMVVSSPALFASAGRQLIPSNAGEARQRQLCKPVFGGSDKSESVGVRLTVVECGPLRVELQANVRRDEIADRAASEVRFVGNTKIGVGPNSSFGD